MPQNAWALWRGSADTRKGKLPEESNFEMLALTVHWLQENWAAYLSRGG